VSIELEYLIQEQEGFRTFPAMLRGRERCLRAGGQRNCEEKQDNVETRISRSSDGSSAGVKKCSLLLADRCPMKGGQPSGILGATEDQEFSVRSPKSQHCARTFSRAESTFDSYPANRLC
jgi:hypothetical protein